LSAHDSGVHHWKFSILKDGIEISSRISCILILYGVGTLCLAKINNSLSNISMIMAHAQQMFSKYSMTQWVIVGQG
jgi:hypothetical protein